MKKQLDAMLISYNLTSKVQTKKETSTAIDNVFIDTLKINSYTTDPTINELSNHDAQPAKPKLSYKNY
jgi:hypothetical protein